MEAILVKLAGLFITGLKLAAGSLVGRAMAALGFTWVNLTYSLPAAKQFVADKFANLPSGIVQVLSATGIDIAMTLILSAIIARMGMRMFVTTLSSIQGLIGQEQGT